MQRTRAPAGVNNGLVRFGADFGVYFFTLCFEPTIWELRFVLFLNNYYPTAHGALCEGVLCRLRRHQWNGYPAVCLQPWLIAFPTLEFQKVSLHFSFFCPSTIAGLTSSMSCFAIWLSGPFTSEFSSSMHEHMARSITDAGRCDASCPLRWMLINAMRCGGNAWKPPCHPFFYPPTRTFAFRFINFSTAPHFIEILHVWIDSQTVAAVEGAWAWLSFESCTKRNLIVRQNTTTVCQTQFKDQVDL